MNFQLFEKLKKLISESVILNSTEKAEWTELLELMNDKQMVELEKILTSVDYSKTPQVKMQPNVPKQAIFIKPQPVTAEPKKQMPKQALGHILNMPQINLAQKPGIGFAAEAPKQITKSPNTGFFKKLTAILKEPELPPGEKENLLPPGEIKPETEPVIMVEPLKLKVQPKTILPPKVPLPPKAMAKPQVLEPQAAQVSPHQPIAQKKEELEKKGIQQWPSRYEMQKKQQPVAMPEEQSLPKSSLQPVQPKVAAKPFQPEVQYSKVAKVQSNAGYDIHFGQQTGSPIKLLEPKDLENFAFENLSEESAKTIKNLARRYGYYGVITYLEKSPFYKSYMNTGSRLLEKSKTFEDSQVKGQTDLDRQKFEQAADLLRVIQAE